MHIGIIGAGQVGLAVARLGVAAGYPVMVSNSRGPDSLREAVAGIGCEAGSVEEAAEFGEVAVAAIPLLAYGTIPSGPLVGKVVLDAINYDPERDGRVLDLDARRTTTGEMLARHLPGARVVKALNAILAPDLVRDARPPGASERRALPIAGDDPAAKATVADLLDRFGFDTVDAGGLAESWRFERAKPASCIPLDRDGLVRALAAAERDVEVPEGSRRR